MGAITSSSMGAAGSGYVANQIVRVSQGSGPNDGAHVVILTVGGGGVPLTLSLPEQGYETTGALRGCGYTVQNGVPTTFGGAASGLTINILAVGPGSDATHGGIFSFSGLTGGVGFAVNDTGKLIQGSNSSSVYKVTGISGGAVVNLSIDPGDGYTAGTVSLVPAGPQSGSGSGASLTLTLGDISSCAFAPGVGSGYSNRVFGGPSKQ